MKCPECGAWVLVKETRPRMGNQTHRRYECGNLHRFSTLETPIPPKGKPDKRLLERKS